MAEAQVQVEAIVREVIRRLREQETRGARGGDALPPQVSHPGGGSEAEVHVSERVVTLAVLEGRLDRVKSILLRPDAVVTPSVHDELRRRGLAVTRQTRRIGTDENHSRSTGSLLVATADADVNSEAVWRIASELNPAFERFGPGALVDLRGPLNACLAQGAGAAIVATRKPSAALCLLNRWPGIRAALGLDGQSVREALAAIGANVLVVNPAATSVHQLREIFRIFVHSESRQPPPELAPFVN
jgi:hypothetical protein